MKSKPLFFLTGALILVCLLIAFGWSRLDTRPTPQSLSEVSEAKSLEKKAARAEYFFNMLRDPATNALPSNIRARELAYARTLPRIDQVLSRTGGAVPFNWVEAGPVDVGGRTRALAVDVTNANVIVAGGASGGIWKSTDGGASWRLKSDLAEINGVTSLAQDPRAGQTNTWYYTSGERSGSAGDQGGGASFFGSGFYRSLDNAETWQRIVVPTGDPTSFDAPLDYVSRVVVSPTTGSVFLASNGYGLFRSADSGASFAFVLGGAGDHEWSDITVATNGTLVATLSSGNENPTNPPGVYRSTDDGQTWTNITPTSFPNPSARSVVAIAPSNNDVAYVLTFTGEGSGATENIRFHKLNLSTGGSEDRSGNLPNFGGDTGFFDTQGSYNMVLAVKPDDENFVLVGGTNLYRTRDGFATAATQLTENWIGGYATANDISQYINQHPDQHTAVFDPANPNRLWSGHDGGLSLVADITTTASEVPWQKMNNGYNVTQYYGIAQHTTAGDGRLFGGAQDNGSPYFRFDGQTATASTDLTTGDGGYVYMGATFAVGSAQNGALQLSPYDQNGDPASFQFSPNITPPNAANQLFINPYAVDPVSENVVYYPGGNVLWRGDLTATMSDPNNAPAWQELTNITLPDGYGYSALTASIAPAHVLYLGASGEGAPVIMRLDNATTATDGEVARSIPGAAAGAYVHAIAVNPENADEIMVVFSNYNVVGLYHSTDGGQTYSAVEGNLTGDASNPGPSLRSATILPFNGEATYLIATSTGVYSTTNLAGASTVWAQEAASGIGNTVTAFITSRTSDGRVAVGTHGRGIFLGTPSQATAIEDDPEQPTAFTLAQNYPNPFNPSTTIAFTLAQPGEVTLSVYDLTGRKVSTLLQASQRTAGVHTVPFDASDLASGTYLYTLDVKAVGSTSRQAKQMTLLR